MEVDCITTSAILDGSIKVWDKQDEYVDSICFVSAIQAAVGGVLVWVVFF